MSPSAAEAHHLFPESDRIRQTGVQQGLGGL